MNDVAARLARVEARFAIQDLVVTYATLLDDQQWDAVGELFAREGVFDSPNSTTVGRQAIVDNFRSKLTKYTWSLHDPHGHSVAFDDETHARGTVIGYSELGTPEYALITSIRYQDDYVVEDGHWRFARRNVLSLYGMPISEAVSGGLSQAERKRWPGRPAAVAELPDVARAHGGYPG